MKVTGLCSIMMKCLGFPFQVRDVKSMVPTLDGSPLEYIVHAFLVLNTMDAIKEEAGSIGIVVFDGFVGSVCLSEGR